MATGNEVSFEAFREHWLTDVQENNPSTVELGRRFAHKLLTQWLDVESGSDDLVYCDGSGDGGIDIAYLDRATGADDDDAGVAVGNTWYVVQSKYGKAFRGTTTLIEESQKVIDSLDGKRQKLSSLAEGLLERLQNFRRQASERDQVRLVFATERPLNEVEKRALEDIRAMGRERLGTLFDVESVSVETIYRGILEEPAAPERLRIPITTHVASSGPDLLIGSVTLLDLYQFLKAYRDKTLDLDQLYEKNVRRFLGGRGKVNRAIQETLRTVPERFGLYNNGITIVVTDFVPKSDGVVELVEPYIVNGCQTTRTIWEVCRQRLDAGGTGAAPELEEWRERAGRGLVVTKIAKVGQDGEVLSQAITRFTNSQNAVRERDFLALTQDFRSWAQVMGDSYNVFLETQRGGWDSRRAFQKQHPEAKPFTEAANAADVLKVYGAGWLGEAGLAFGKNPPFLPNGAVFKRIMDVAAGDEPFGVEDLFVAYRLQQAADDYKFGRGAPQLTRRQTRFLFYMATLDLLRDVMTRAGITVTPKASTHALLKLFQASDTTSVSALLETAVEVIDAYLTPGTDDSVFDEPAFRNAFNQDLNGFLKWERLGKSDQDCPRLRNLLAVNKSAMGRKIGNQPSVRDQIRTVVVS